MRDDGGVCVVHLEAGILSEDEGTDNDRGSVAGVYELIDVDDGGEVTRAITEVVQAAVGLMGAAVRE